MMKRLQKLIFTEYILNLTIILSALTLTVFIFDFLEFADEIIILPFLDILQFLILRIPYFVSYTALYSIALASVLSLLSLSHRFELAALFTSNVSERVVAKHYIFLISITAVIAFFNEGFLSPYCYRESMILIDREKAFNEVEIKDVTIKKENAFLFIERIENGGKVAKNTIEVRLDNIGNIKGILVIPVAEKRSNSWIISNAHLFNDTGERLGVNEAQKFDLSDAVINLAYKPKFLTISHIKRLLDFATKFGIDVAKYTAHLSRLILHIFSPLLIFFLFFKIIPITVNDRNRILIAVKLVFFLILYSIVETNVYNYSVANKINAVFPAFAIIFSFFVGTLIIKRQR